MRKLAIVLTAALLWQSVGAGALAAVPSSPVVTKPAVAAPIRADVPEPRAAAEMPMPGVMVAMNATASKTPQADAGPAIEADGTDPLSSVRLGESLKAFYTTHGKPWVVVYRAKVGYWGYRTDHDRGWLVVGVAENKVRSAQVLARAHMESGLGDGSGIVLGDTIEKLRSLHGGLTRRDDVMISRAVEGVMSFYGLSKKTGRIDRIGRTLGDTTLPVMLRWYQFSGWSPDRAIPLAASGGTAAGEARYLRATHPDIKDPNIMCVGGNVWTPLSHKRQSYLGVPLDAVQARCGTAAYERIFYFALNANEPRAFDDDEHSQGLLVKAGVTDTRGLTALGHRRAGLGTITPQIWFTVPNGSRFLNDYTDLTMDFIYDPSDPPTSITMSYTTDGTAPHLARARGARGHPLVLSGSPCDATYHSGSGNAKCTDNPGFPPPTCPTVSGSDGTSSIMTAIMCFFTSGNPNNQPRPHPGNPNSNGNAGGGSWWGGGGAGGPGGGNGGGGGGGGSGESGGTTGCPIEAVSGKLWYANQDFQLSGPFGMTFQHRYDSDLATYQGDLGVGWRDTYGAYLDISNISNGAVLFYDANCNREYFGTVGPSTTVYDQYGGGSLTTTASGSTITGFTLTTWDHRTLNFDAEGRLSSLSDRVGNTQTISRDGSERISTVTDQLGRSLSFSYDTSNRVISIASTPSAISVSMTYDSGTNCYTGDLCSVQESDGSTWNYQYDDPSTKGGNHLLKEVIDPLGHVEESNTYTLTDLGNGDDNYRVTEQQRDSGMNDYTYAYSISGNIGTTSITNATVGQTTTYTWDQKLQQVLTVSGALCQCNGSSIAYTYDVFGRVQTVSEGGVLEHSNTYGRDQVFTSPDGTLSYVSVAYPSVTDTYDYGIQTIKGPQTRHVQYAYYAMGDPRQDLVETTTEPSVDTPGNTVTTTFTYGTNGLLTSRARQGYVNGTSTTYTTSYAYDGLGRITSVTGPRTDVTQQTTYAYYSDTDSDLARRGQLETVSRYVSGSLNLTTTYASASLPSPYDTYTIYGGTGSVTDPNGVVTDFTYDALGRLTTSTIKGVSGDPTDLVTTIAYDAAGRMTGITKPLGNGLAFGYDTVNNPTNTITVDASGNQHDQLLSGYDAVSELTSKDWQACTTPASSCSTWSTKRSEAYSYTSLGNLSAITYPTGGSTSLTWDTSGNRLSSSTGDSSYAVTTHYAYDTVHNMTLMGLGSLQFTTSLYTHDLQGNLDSVTARLQSSATTAYQHDDFGNVRKMTSPYAGVSSATYDAAGNQTSFTNANNATTATTYDPLNRPLTATSTKSGSTTETVTWSYDDATSGTYRLGRLYQTTDPTGSKTYTYDRRGNVTTLAQVANGNTYTTTYGYDGNGNRTSMTLPSGRALTYTFDYADRPSGVSGTYDSSPTTYVSSATYEPFGPRVATAFGNGTTQTFSYNQRYLPTENLLTNGSGTLSELTYAENAVGYVTSVTDALSAGYDQAYAYGGNATNMLTDANTGSSLWGKAHYADAYAQNLTQALFPTHPLTFKLAQRTAQVQGVFNQSTGTNESVSYDAAGNESTIGSATYTYSPRNLLASGDGITYTYDGFGQRVNATTTISGNSATETSLYGLGRHLQTQTSLSSGSVAYDYVWLGDMPVAEEDIGGSYTYWTAMNHLGAPIILTNSGGSIAWQGDYEPSGSLYQVRMGSSIHQPLRLPGQEAEIFDGSAGINGFSGRLYNGARWYRTQWGRYTQGDPLGYEGSSYNLYPYANNNPLNENDSSGEDVGGTIIGGGFGYVIGSAVGGTLGAAGAGGVSDGVLTAGGWVAGSQLGGQIGTDVGSALGSLIPAGDMASGDNANAQSDNSSGDTSCNSGGGGGNRTGSTQGGNPVTQHAEDQFNSGNNGAPRNVPGSVIDQTINEGSSQSSYNDTTVYYDPVNNVTVVTSNSDGAIITFHLGPP